MRLKPVLFSVVFSTVLLACSEDKPAAEKVAAPVAREEKPTEPAAEKPDTAADLIVNTEQTNDWVKALNNLNTENFTADKKPFTNRHNPAVTDTILTLTNGTTTIDFYRTPSQDMLQSARINDAALNLNGVKTGMKKADLEKILDLTIPGNTVNVTDEERFSTFRFRFAADTLQAIIFEGYVD